MCCIMVMQPHDLHHFLLDCESDLEQHGGASEQHIVYHLPAGEPRDNTRVETAGVKPLLATILVTMLKR